MVGKKPEASCTADDEPPLALDEYGTPNLLVLMSLKSFVHDVKMSPASTNMDRIFFFIFFKFLMFELEINVYAKANISCRRKIIKFQP